MNPTHEQYAQMLARHPERNVKEAVEASRMPQERSGEPEGVKVAPQATETIVAKKRIRQALPRQNRWELEWAIQLKAQTHLTVMSHAMKLQLASGCWYEPDIFAWDAHLNRLLAYEVKGFARDDAVVKLKVAARVYPWIAFWLVWKDKGQWQEQPILQ